MEIRDLTEKDSDIYWELRLRALKEEPDAFGSDYDESRQRSREELVRRMPKAGQQSDHFLLGAFEGGKLVGTVGLHREEGIKSRHKAMVWGMYVAPEARGQGVGRALMDEAIARARRTPDLVQIYLTVMHTKQAARELYRSLGFEVYGVEARSIRIDDTYYDADLMILKLDQAP